MASIADTLITNFVLKDDYSAGVNKAASATSNFAKHAKAAQGAVSGGGGLTSGLGLFKDALGSIGNALTTVTAGIAAVVGAGVGLVDLASKAIDKFAEYDSIERIFTGIYGSADKAKQMMSYLNAEAQKGQFTFKDLAETAKSVVMTGLKFDSYKEFIELVGMKAGGGAEGLREAANILTRISSGQGGEGWRRLKEMGFGPGLAKLGIVFDKSGEFKGNVTQAMNALKGLGESGKGILDAMEGSAAAGMANIREAFTRSFAAVGGEIWEQAGGFIGKVADTINQAIDSGAIKSTVDSILSMFNFNYGESSMADSMARILASLEAASVYTAHWLEGLGIVLEYMEKIYRASPAGIVGSALNHIRGIDGKDAKPDEISKFLRDAYGGTAYDEAYERNKALMAQKKAAGAEPDNPNALQQIANNTAETAKHTKEAKEHWARNVFGGGDLGRYGVTAMELHRRNASSQNATLNIVGLKSLDDFLKKAFFEGMAHAKRLGY